MRISKSFGWALAAAATVLLIPANIWGQLAEADLGGPAPRSLTQAEIGQRRALELYGLCLLRARAGRASDAEQALEKAVKLDPEAAPLYKTQVLIFLALDRPAEALAASRKALALDPADYEVSYALARQLKMEGNLGEAQAALAHAFKCRALRDNPEAFYSIAFELGNLYEAQGDNARALTVFDEVAENQTGDASKAALAYERISAIARRLKDYSRAASALLKAQSIYREQDPPRAARLEYELAQVLFADGDPAGSLRHLRPYLLSQPPDIEPYRLLVQALHESGRDADMVTELRTAAERDLHNGSLKLLLAEQLAHSGKDQEAERIYLALIAEAPTPASLKGLFAIYVKEGRIKEILSRVNDAFATGAQKGMDGRRAANAGALVAILRHDPELVRKLLPLAVEQERRASAFGVETRRLLALLAAADNQLEAAETLYRGCLTSGVDSQSETAIYDGLFRVLWAESRPDKVAEVARLGLEKARATSRLLFHTNLARALVRLDQPKDAVREADEALRLAEEGNSIPMRLFHAQILAQADRLDEALAECRALLNVAPGPYQREVQYTLSGIYTFARDSKGAQEQLRAILQEDPNDAAANNDLGYIMADENVNLEEAETLIRKALQLDAKAKAGKRPSEGAEEPANAAFVDSLGWVLFRRGRLKDARQEMERAVALPDGASDPAVWEHLGEVYYQMDELPRAGAAWRHAVHLYETDHRRKRDHQYYELKTRLEILDADGPLKWFPVLF